jgi:hypothetical protein
MRIGAPHAGMSSWLRRGRSPIKRSLWCLVLTAALILPTLSIGAGTASAAGTGTVTGTVTDQNGVPFASPITAVAYACPAGTLGPNGCVNAVQANVDSSGHYTLSLASSPASWDIVGLAYNGGNRSNSPPVFGQIVSDGGSVTLDFRVPTPPPPGPPTIFTYNGATSGDLGDQVTYSVLVTDSLGNPKAGQFVMFGGIPTPPPFCTAISDASGVAACTGMTPGGHVGLTTFGTSFGPPYQGVWFAVTPEETVLTYTGPTVVAAGSPVALRGSLLSDDGVPIVGATVALNLGGQSCTATTDATGAASCPVTPTGAGILTATGSFGGNTDYLPSNATGVAVIVAEFPSSGGNFVIGNQNATLGNSVTYWGAQWSMQELQLFLGAPPKSFKGFASGPAAGASCGQMWSTTPGNSSGPPATVPGYMAVLATNSITQSGSTIVGNITSIVILKTDPGYAGNPGHAGTGTVVAVLPCP